MDPELLKGLRDAKQLLDEGILTPYEFLEQKAFLLKKYMPISPSVPRHTQSCSRASRVAGCGDLHTQATTDAPAGAVKPLVRGHTCDLCNEEVPALDDRFAVRMSCMCNKKICFVLCAIPELR